MGFHVDQASGAGDRRVVGRHLVQPRSQKTAQRQRVRRPPCDATLAVDAFKIPDEQQTEVPPRRQTRPPHPLRVEPGALLFHPFVKAALFQQSVQLFVKRMRYRPRQVCLCDPNRLLSSLPRFSAHCHARSLLPTVVNHSTIYDENPDLHHGLLAPGILWTNLTSGVVKLTHRVDRCHLESGPWVHQDQPRMQALLRGNVCGALSRGERTSLRTRLRPALGPGENQRTIPMALTQAGVCEFDERFVSLSNSRRICRRSLVSHDNCRLAHISGAHKEIGAVVRPFKWKAALCCGSGKHLVGSQCGGSQARTAKSRTFGASERESALFVH